MSLLFCDGAEIDFADNTAGIWTSFTRDGTGPTLQYASTTARTGTGAMRFNSTTATVYAYLTRTITSSTEIYMGFGFYWDSAQALAAHASGNNVVPMLVLASTGGDHQITLGIDQTSNVLKAFTNGNDGGTLRGTGSTGVSSDTWHYVEIHAVINDSTGSIEVRLNTNSEFNVTGIDTNIGSGDVLSVQLGIPRSSAGGANGGAGRLWYDDVTIIDTTGSITNSWPNGAGVEILNPDGDGNYSQWTSTGGAVDYTEVDDVTTYNNLPDDDTTKLNHAVVGERTSVTLSDTVAGGTVLGVQLLSYTKNDAAGSDNMAHFVRISSTDYDQSDFVPDTSYGWRLDPITASPATSVAFTTAEIDGMELGWKIS